MCSKLSWRDGCLAYFCLACDYYYFSHSHDSLTTAATSASQAKSPYSPPNQGCPGPLSHWLSSVYSEHSTYTGCLHYFDFRGIISVSSLDALRWHLCNCLVAGFGAIDAHGIACGVSTMSFGNYCMPSQRVSGRLLRRFECVYRVRRACLMSSSGMES